MKFIDNFSETHLLFSEPIDCVFYGDENQTILLASFQIKLPTIRDMYFNSNVMFVLTLLKYTIKDLNEQMKLSTPAQSHLDLFIQLSQLSAITPSLVNSIYKIREGLKILCPELTLTDNNILIKNRVIDDCIFERMRHIWLISIDAKAFSKTYQYMSPEQRVMEEKIQYIKNKNKNKNNKSEDGFEKIYMILTYEFHYTRNEILEMTMYAVKTILKYTSKSINYKLTLIAKANGNTKKVKFITDKGD